MDKSQKLFSFSVTNGIATLVYSDFLNKIYKSDKSDIFMIPEIRSVESILDPKYPFMQSITDKLLVTIFEYYKKDIKYHNDTLDSLLKYDNTHSLQKLLITNIIPNAQRAITEVLRRKFFPINNDETRYYEDRDLQVFDTPITYDMVSYIIRETYLHLLSYTSTTKTFHESIPELIKFISGIADLHIHIIIQNAQEMAPVIFDKEVIENDGVYPLLSHITGATFEISDKQIKFRSNANNTIKYF